MPVLFRINNQNKLFQCADVNTLVPSINILTASLDSNFVDITSNLLWWYPFESGDITGSSVYNWANNTNDATIVGSPTITNTAYKTGSNSLSLSNANSPVTQYLQLPNIDLGTSSQDYSVCIWWKNSINTYYSTISIFGNSTNNPLYQKANLLYTNNSNVLTECYNGTNIAYSSAGSYSDNTWHLIVWKFNPTATSHSVNIDNGTYTGSVGSSSYYINGTNNSTNANYVGYSPWDTGQRINGNIDDYRFYNNSLTTQQISAIYNIANSTAILLTYSVVRSGTNFTINWTGTNIACITLSNLTQNKNYGRFTTSGSVYSGISYNTNDKFYITPYDSTNTATAKAGLASKIFTIS